jgi:predicted alpha/beta-fold hydrolase
MKVAAGWHGHWWTLAPWAFGSLRALPERRRENYAVRVPDARHGQVRLTGFFAPREGARGCVVVVHGLGGIASAPYVWRGFQAAQRAGFAALSLNLRGADRSGEDIYHAGLTDDLHAAFASPELARYEELYLIGYSLGGHVALKAACERVDPRLVAVAAVCAPLDLAMGRTYFDRGAAVFYRRHVVSGMRAIALAADARRSLGFDRAAITRARTLAEMDALTVVPRFGFRDLADYDAQSTVAPRLSELRVPALYVGATRDPMVPRAAVEPYARAPRLEVRWGRGGHVGFPGGDAVDREVLAWLSAARARG